MGQRLTREEFHRWAQQQIGRYERIASEPVAMSPERAVHVRIKSRIWAALDRAVARSGVRCEALADGMTIEIDDDTDYEPDAVVTCGPPLPPDATVVNNPVVVVEVLSPATQSIDSSDKLADYFRHPSVQHYLVVRTKRREVIHHRRAGADIISRPVHVGAILLDPPGIEIELTEIYGPES